MKPKWIILELRRFDRVLLQISKYNLDVNKHEVVGTITLDEVDMESKIEWLKAIETMNLEHSPKSSSKR